MEIVGSTSYRLNQPTSLTQFYQELTNLRDKCINEESHNINCRTIECFLSTCFENGNKDEKFNALMDMSLELHMCGQKKAASSISRQLKESNLLPTGLCMEAGLYYWHLGIETDINAFAKWFQPIADKPNRPIAACYFATALMEHEPQTSNNLKNAIRYFEKSASKDYAPANEGLIKAHCILNNLEHPEPTSNAHFKFSDLLGRAKIERHTIDKETPPKRARLAELDISGVNFEQTIKPMIRSHSSPAELNKSKNEASEFASAPPPKKKYGFRSRGHSKSVNAVPDSVKNRKDNPSGSLHPNQTAGTKSASGSPSGIKVIPSIKEESSEESTF
jgi:hypothetical protein